MSDHLKPSASIKHTGIAEIPFRLLRRFKALLPRALKRKVRRLLGDLHDSTMYRLSRSRAVPGEISHIVFVCKGNICRSAFAEFYLKARAPESDCRIESCGLDVDQGTFSPRDAVRAGREFGLDLELNRSKGVAACDLKSAELIVAMEYPQYRRLVELLPRQREKIRLLRDFAPFPARLFCNIHDPFGLGEAEFRRCFRTMQQTLDNLKARLPGRQQEKTGAR